MSNNVILARMGEVTLKGLNRGNFESKLKNNLKYRLKNFGKLNIYQSQSRIWIEPVEGEENPYFKNEETATEMAFGVKARAGADFGVSSTGIAGPGGGTKEKPVGLVYIGCAYGQDKCKVKKLNLDGDRSQVRAAAAKKALELLEECLSEIEG